MKGESTYFPYFDWLRGILAITVVLFHDGLIRWAHAGSFAVEVFFALSGWLIGGILLKTVARDLPRFYFNRSIRIWAPYYLAVVLLTTAALLHDTVTAKWIEISIYNITSVYNLFGPQQLAEFKSQMPLQGSGNHLWSVNAEEQFYLLAPLLLVLLNKKIGRSSITWVLIAAAAWYSQIYASIVFGVLAAVLVYNHGAFQNGRWARAGWLAVALVSFAGMVAGYDFESLAPFCSIAIVLLLAVYGKQGFVGSVVGGMSYQLYLNHWIATFVAHGLIKRLAPHHEYLSPFISVPLGIIIATGMYWMIDRPLHTLRGRWFTKNRGIAVIVLGYGMCLVGCAYHLAVSRAHHYQAPSGSFMPNGTTKSDIPSPSMDAMK